MPSNSSTYKLAQFLGRSRFFTWCSGEKAPESWKVLPETLRSSRVTKEYGNLGHLCADVVAPHVTDSQRSGYKDLPTTYWSSYYHVLSAGISVAMWSKHIAKLENPRNVLASRRFLITKICWFECGTGHERLRSYAHDPSSPLNIHVINFQWSQAPRIINCGFA